MTMQTPQLIALFICLNNLSGFRSFLDLQMKNVPRNRYSVTGEVFFISLLCIMCNQTKTLLSFLLLSVGTIVLSSCSSSYSFTSVLIVLQKPSKETDFQAKEKNTKLLNIVTVDLLLYY